MAKRELTENQKAAKSIRRNHVIGWSAGLGFGSALGLLGFNIGFNVASGLVSLENVFSNVAISALPMAGGLLVVGGLIGGLIGYRLSKNEEHLDKHLKKRQQKQEKLQSKQEKKTRVKEDAVEKLMGRDVEEFKGNSVVLKDMQGKVLNEFFEVEKDKASYKDGKFSDRNQLLAIMSKNMPDDEVLVELNGKTVAEYKKYQGNGTVQTQIHENVKSWKKIIDNISDKVYGKKFEVSINGAEEEKVL